MQASKYHVLLDFRLNSKKHYSSLQKLLKKRIDLEVVREPFSEPYISLTNSYGFIRKKQTGRIYSKRFCIPSLSNDLRVLFLNKNFIDIDLREAGFTILLEYARKHKLDFKLKELSYYTKDENLYIENLAKDNNYYFSF